MAKPIAEKVVLPLDTGNTGKKMRTQSRVVGADTVHEHFFIKGRQAEVLGVYRMAMAQFTVQAAAQNGTSTGFLWAHVPSAVSNKKVRIRKIRINSANSTVLATPTAARVAISRITFTGTASGASAGTPGKNDATYPASIFDLRTAVTGLTVSLVALLAVAPIIQCVTAVGAVAPRDSEIVDTSEEDDWIVLAPGEGLAFWQDVAGSTSDTRKININLVWDEIDTA